MTSDASSERTFQGSIPYTATPSTDTSSKDEWASHKPRCDVPGCEHVRFSKEKELTRHMKKHDPNAILWQCGCCQNLGAPYKAKERKDKVRDHLRSRHQSSGSEDTKGIDCPVDNCYTLITAASCLDEHLRQEHVGHYWDLSNQTSNGWSPLSI